MAGGPFAFSSDSMGIAAGGAGVMHGLGPTRASLVLMGTYSINNSGIGMAGLYSAGFDMDSRWRFDTEMIGGKFTKSRLYNPTGTADSNSSSHKDYLERKVSSQDFRVRAKWLMPIGSGVGGYKPKGSPFGLPLDDGSSHPVGNPWISGETTIGAEYFYKTRGLNKPIDEETSKEDYRSSGVKAVVEYDNRNGYASPTAGARTQLFMTRDWGAGNSTPYTKWELSHAQYFSLGTSDWLRQQVLAVNAYASDIPTWDKDGPSTQPPWFARSNLGGMEPTSRL